MNRPEVAATLALTLANFSVEKGREFELVRHEDVTGLSGTGVVADGVELRSGTVVLAWRGDHPSITVWPSIDEVIAVHGHSGSTVVRWC